VRPEGSSAGPALGRAVLDRVQGVLAGGSWGGVTGAGSFEVFVAGHSTALLRTAHLLTGDRGPARDLLQTALIAASRRWTAVPDSAAATALVRRELVAAHTSRWRRLRIGDLLAESTLLAGTAGLPGFARPAADAGPHDDLTAALLRLPPRQRVVLVLGYGEGLPEATTADALGVPAEEVRAWAVLGLARLHRLLGATDAGAEDALPARLRRDLPARAAGVVAPEDVLDDVLDGARSLRRHRAGLAALAVFVVLAGLVVLTLG
jgi:DNA-directed RNA polymerase specialized sigma24 family protein